MEVKQLWVTNKEETVTIVKNISFSVQAGRSLRILGESGSGKTTIAKAILGILPSSLKIKEGVICLGGTNNQKSIPSPVRGKNITMVMQDCLNAFEDNIKLGKQIAVILEENQICLSKHSKPLILETFAKVSLKDPERVFNAYAFECSGGMLQRVMISICILLNPDVLIADEPTTALDAITQREILKEIKKIKENTNTALLFISHNLGAIRYIADDVIVLQEGIAVDQGDIDRVFSFPQSPYTKTLLANKREMDAIFLKTMGVVKTDDGT